jgi:hypothetical protein
MGHDVQAIANHQLNTSNMQLLASDLATRLNATVQYGYKDDLFIEGISNETYDVVIIGSIEKQSKNTYVLIDAHYLDKIKHPKEFADKVFYELYDDVECTNNTVDILKFVCQPFTKHYQRWWHFCKCFTGEVSGWNGLNFYRKCVNSAIQELGGNAAIYFDDQGPSAEIFNLEEYATFEEIKLELEKEFKDDFLHITSLLKQYPNFNFPDTGKYPLAFYDDFMDVDF